MSGDNGISRVDGVLDILGILWNPGVEAMRVQKELNVRSLGDTVAAVERAGYEVCYAELPDKVSGFAAVIEGSHTSWSIEPSLGITWTTPCPMNLAITFCNIY